MKLSVLVVLMCLNLAAFAQNDDMVLYEGETYVFSYPMSWEVNHARMSLTSFMVLSPVKDEDDTFKENVNYLTNDLEDPKTSLKQYTAQTKLRFEASFTNAKMVSSETLNKNGYTYQRVIYTGEKGGTSYKILQHYILIGGVAHVLTYTAEANQFDSYLALADKILASFKLQ